MESCLSIVTLNCRLHTVSVRKPSEQMSNFWIVRFFKTDSNLHTVGGKKIAVDV